MDPHGDGGGVGVGGQQVRQKAAWSLGVKWTYKGVSWDWSPGLWERRDGRWGSQGI